MRDLIRSWGYRPKKTFWEAGFDLPNWRHVKWGDFTFDGAYDGMVVLPDSNTDRIAGVNGKELRKWLRLVGAGAEFGSEENRFDLRVTYSKVSIRFQLGRRIALLDSKN